MEGLMNGLFGYFEYEGQVCDQEKHKDEIWGQVCEWEVWFSPRVEETTKDTFILLFGKIEKVFQMEI